MANYQLDAKNLLCPMPVIRCQNRVKELESGDILEVIATDPGVLSDIPSWCRINGHKVLDSKEENNIISVTLEVDGLGA